MGRVLRRVPLDFNYPQNSIWYGFYINKIKTCISNKEEHCDQCRLMAKIKGIPMTSYNCPDFDAYLEDPMKKIKELLAPPVGEGYQLWETTSEGGPVSPVFASLDELCEWCEKNATPFADDRATKEQWKKMLE